MRWCACVDLLETIKSLGMRNTVYEIKGEGGMGEWYGESHGTENISITNGRN